MANIWKCHCSRRSVEWLKAHRKWHSVDGFCKPFDLSSTSNLFSMSRKLLLSYIFKGRDVDQACFMHEVQKPLSCQTFCTYICKIFARSNLSQNNWAIFCLLLRPQDFSAKVADTSAALSACQLSGWWTVSVLTVLYLLVQDELCTCSYENSIAHAAYHWMQLTFTAG